MIKLARGWPHGDSVFPQGGQGAQPSATSNSGNFTSGFRGAQQIAADASPRGGPGARYCASGTAGEPSRCHGHAPGPGIVPNWEQIIKVICQILRVSCQMIKVIYQMIKVICYIIKVIC